MTTTIAQTIAQQLGGRAMAMLGASQTMTNAAKKVFETATLNAARAGAMNENRKLAEARRHFEAAIAELEGKYDGY